LKAAARRLIDIEEGWKTNRLTNVNESFDSSHVILEALASASGVVIIGNVKDMTAEVLKLSNAVNTMRNNLDLLSQKANSIDANDRPGAHNPTADKVRRLKNDLSSLRKIISNLLTAVIERVNTAKRVRDAEAMAIITLAFQIIRTDTDEQRIRITPEDVAEFISLALENDRLDRWKKREVGSVNENANVKLDERTVIKSLNLAIERLFATHSLPACFAPITGTKGTAAEHYMLAEIK
jgi:hypothetical protein